MPFINDTVLAVLPELQPLIKLRDEPYKPDVAYGNFYTTTLTYLEDRLDSIYSNLNADQVQAVDRLVFAIYHNNNHILEDTEWFKEVNSEIRPHSDAGEVISFHLEDSSPAINERSPKKAESLLNRFCTLFTPNFKPQLETNVPSIKHSSYQSNVPFVEYRISTQGQRHKGEIRVSPLFKRWLAISAQKCSPEKVVNHVYFNNLGLDRDKLDIPGTNEKELTKALHQLEEDHSLKTIVITLPASKSLMGATHYKIVDDRLSYSSVFDEFLNIALHQKHPSGVADFRISPAARALLFDKNEEQLIRNLLTTSFETMGITPEQYFSTAKKQAVWMHFIKFELTNYILNKLRPNSCNFSCKDAIDRGAVSSVYYHLHHSFLLDQPMSKEEFERDLDIAAANVKGRGMNFHRKIIWNTLDTFINAHYHQLVTDKRKTWLINWRDMNCPHARVKPLVGIRIKQYEDLLCALPADKGKIRTNGLKLLEAVKNQYSQKVSGQRLLLEVVSRSVQLLSDTPSEESLAAYKRLADELHINHPSLLIIAGAMLTFLGTVLFYPSLKKHGLAKMQAGFFAPQREELCQLILDVSASTSPLVLEDPNAIEACPPLSPQSN